MTAALNFLIAATTLLAVGCASPDQGPGSTTIAGAKSRFARFGTNKVHYVVAGKGKHVVVFIHGWAANLGFWREQAPVLADKASLILIDLPGHGQSDKPHTAYTIDFFAEAVLAVMRDAHVDSATLIGHSMGARVGFCTYNHAPHRVEALMSVNALLRSPKLAPGQIEGMIGWTRLPDYREQIRRSTARQFQIPGNEALRDRIVSEQLETPQHVMVSAMEGLFGPNQPDSSLHHANVPVLVINSNEPTWTDEYRRFVESLSAQTEYRTIDGAGHWPMLEKPSEFNAVLVETLRKFDLIE